MLPLTLPQAFQLALQHHQAGRLAEAEAIYQQILTVDPRHAEARHFLGLVAQQTGRREKAIELLHQSVALVPDSAMFQSNLGNVLFEQGAIHEAIAAYRRAIGLNPALVEAQANLGRALGEIGQYATAIAAYRAAVALRPTAEWHNTLGDLLRTVGQSRAAIAACREAIALRPDFAEAYNHLGSALRDEDLLDEAAAAFRQAIVLRPDFAAAWNNLGTSLRDAGRLEEALDAYRRARALEPGSARIHSNLVFALHFDPRSDGAVIAAELRAWNAQHAEPVRAAIAPHLNERTPGRRLRVGYVSPDLREHPVGRFLLPLLAHHDRRNVEVFCYSDSAIADAMAGRLRSHTEHWHDIAGQSDEQVARVIQQHRIDVLVDLTAHTARNRLRVFARKPAPVQVTYLAYPGSSGLSTMDYRLSDSLLDPAGGDEAGYPERTVRLPHNYWCYEAWEVSPVSELPALAAGYVTFGCLNNFNKMSWPTVAVWARILRRVSGARLLLYAPEGSHRQRVLEEFRRAGVDPQRVSFVGWTPMAAYHQLYARVDVALDPFPYGGGMTTCDALWMGVPVVSLAGKTAVGRGGMSILSNVGLPELVAKNEEEYVEFAARLAGDLGWLGELRTGMRRRMKASPLMDAARFAGEVEAAYRVMWVRWCGRG